LSDDYVFYWVHLLFLEELRHLVLRGVARWIQILRLLQVLRNSAVSADASVASTWPIDWSLNVVALLVKHLANFLAFFHRKLVLEMTTNLAT